MRGTSRWLAGSGMLGLALAWRLRREGLRYFLAALVPFVVVLSLPSALASVTHGRGINGAVSDAVIGARYGAHANTIAVGILLTIAPGMVAIFSALGMARMMRGLIGAELSRGGLEVLLAAPYTPGNIAGALLGLGMLVAFGFWLALSTLGAMIIAIVTTASSDQLSIGAGYLGLVLIQPLLTAWAATGLAMLLSLLFPRLTQLGAAVNVAGGDVSSGAALLPGIGLLLGLIFGLSSLGPLRLLLITGGSTALILVITVVVVAVCFRPETALDS